jgi:hypothetical protein
MFFVRLFLHALALLVLGLALLYGGWRDMGWAALWIGGLYWCAYQDRRRRRADDEAWRLVQEELHRRREAAPYN